MENQLEKAGVTQKAQRYPIKKIGSASIENNEYAVGGMSLHINEQKDTEATFNTSKNENKNGQFQVKNEFIILKIFLVKFIRIREKLRNFSDILQKFIVQQTSSDIGKMEYTKFCQSKAK